MMGVLFLQMQHPTSQATPSKQVLYLNIFKKKKIMSRFLLIEFFVPFIVIFIFHFRFTKMKILKKRDFAKQEINKQLASN